MRILGFGEDWQIFRELPIIIGMVTLTKCMITNFLNEIMESAKMPRLEGFKT
jgi:hypothetical protein